MNTREESLLKHAEWKGKIEIVTRVSVSDARELSLAYTPGVAEPCLAIAADRSKSWSLTRRRNLVAVVTDGTAVLGLGDIGPEAAMPVMEGKCALFKSFADVDAFPICLNTKDVNEIVQAVRWMAPGFGGINLEDISAPRCFEVERRLQEECDIPVFHDDQHGTAIVLGGALINALKLVAKKIEEIRIVINGAGAAGISIAKHLLRLGANDVTLCDRFGVLYDGMNEGNEAQKQIGKLTNPRHLRGNLSDAMRKADVFIGVSAPNVVTEDMVRSMAEKPIVFPMANPTPEIDPDAALVAGAYIVGTGRSDRPNQINNVLVFPGLFRGALDAGATRITENMKMAATAAIASLVSDEELRRDYIVPKAFDKRVGPAVAEAVAKQAVMDGVIRK